ncbi:hypothetical protein OIU78_007718 [Salix suchowensis]|nr:hypothetical protein OIU78_007718 [Salix suchowensis]
MFFFHRSYVEIGSGCNEHVIFMIEVNMVFFSFNFNAKF